MACHSIEIVDRRDYRCLATRRLLGCSRKPAFTLKTKLLRRRAVTRNPHRARPDNLASMLTAYERQAFGGDAGNYLGDQLRCVIDERLEYALWNHNLTGAFIVIGHFVERTVGPCKPVTGCSLSTHRAMEE